MSDPAAAVNASPLIYLARSGDLELLQLAAREILVPEAVAGEILRRGSEDPGARALATLSWIRRVEAPAIPEQVASWGLGAGESAVLALCLGAPGTRAVMDDLAGRRCAEALGIPLRGTLGLVLRAKKRGVLPSARVVLARLRASGMYLSDRVLDAALAEVGE